jgi:uncharacterized membrane protein
LIRVWDNGDGNESDVAHLQPAFTNLMQRIYYYYGALTGFFGLFFLLMAWHTLITPSSKLPTALLLVFSVGPLLLPLRGFLNRDLKSCTWMSYLSLPYFAHGIAEAYVNQGERPYALLEVLFSLLLCFGAGLYVYKAEKV